MEGIWYFTNRVRSTMRPLVWKSQFAGTDMYMHAVANLWYPVWSPNSDFTTIESYRLLPVGSRLVHNRCLSKDMGPPSQPSSTPVGIRVATATYGGLPAFHGQQKLWKTTRPRPYPIKRRGADSETLQSM